jgi:hypothetical protein
VRYFGGKKSCCICNTKTEDWIHTLTCPSIDACMNREELWAKARKAMKHWKLPNDFWIAMERGLHRYTRNPKGGAITPPPPTYDNRQNHLKLASREQYEIGWDNLIKGLMGRQWIEYVKQHIQIENTKLQAKEWEPIMILTSWDHMLRLLQYRSDALHEDDNKRVVQFKVEALDRDIKRRATRHNDSRSKLHDFQERHTNRRERIQT